MLNLVMSFFSTHPKMRIAVVTAAVGAGVASSVLASTKQRPVVKGAPTAWNRAIQRLCPHLSRSYELPWILNNGHVRSRGISRYLAVSLSAHRVPSRLVITHFFSSVQVETIFAALFRTNPHLTYEREIITMPDGGVVALDSEASTDLPVEAPVLVLLPGLTGGSGDT